MQLQILPIIDSLFIILNKNSNDINSGNKNIKNYLLNFLYSKEKQKVIIVKP